MTTEPGTTSVTICSLGHADVWSLTSSLLPKFVPAENHLVYVPEAEIGEFSTITDERFQILPQETLGLAYRGPLREVMARQKNLGRYGWYLQQFYKIEALARIETERCFIWDADCVPVREIPLFDSAGAPLYMRGTEFHGDYFDMVERLLGLGRIHQHSFVIPGFPMLTGWVREFIEEIESLNSGMRWHEAIVHHTDFGLRSGFSETETLGTWVSHRKVGEWGLTRLNWERRGQSRFGPARNFNPNTVTDLGEQFDLDIISFENWDKGKKIPLQKRMRKFRTKLLRALRFEKKKPME